jgi:protoheme IX farnesyltransferase
LVLFPIALVPAFLGVAGVLYAVTAVVLNIGFILHAVRVLRSTYMGPAKAMFGYSLLYLALHFAVLMIDRAPGLLSGLIDPAWLRPVGLVG